MSAVGITVFAFLFAFVTAGGFAAARWRRGDLSKLDEWGLGGRRFGTVVSWFMLGGDLYTAYTLIAVPALVFGAGAIGFFAVPYAIVAFVLGFAFLPRLWSVTRRHGYLTAADFVEGRFGSRTLGVLVAITAIFATMPYLALQLVGMEVALAGLGVPTGGLFGEIPLIVAFVILAAFTYTSGLRAPAVISFVKDGLIYAVIIVGAIVIPAHLGGYGHIFSALPSAKTLLATATHGSGMLGVYATFALGSAMALFLYPHAMTGALATSGRHVIQRNMALLPVYSLLLVFVMVFGYMAYVAGVGNDPQFAAGFARYGPNYAIIALFLHEFPDWFAGMALAAIMIGALVPSAIMSIAAANLFARNLYRPLRRGRATAEHETRVAKVVSLVIKLGALAFVLALPMKFAIQFQLLGGIWIIQIFPPIVFGLYLSWLRREALIAGWIVGTGLGTWMAAGSHLASPVYPLHLFGLALPGYAALYSVIVNIVVVFAVTGVLALCRYSRNRDATRPADYLEEARTDAMAGKRDASAPVPGLQSAD